MRFPEASAESLLQLSLPVTGEGEECGCLCPAACWSHQVCVGMRASSSVLIKLLGASLGGAARVGPSCPVSNRAPRGWSWCQGRTVQPDPLEGKGSCLGFCSAGLCWQRGGHGGLATEHGEVHTSDSAHSQGCGCLGIQQVLLDQPIFWDL